MAFSQNFRAKRKNDFGLENALAGFCRRKWSDKPIPNIQREWALTEAEASNVLYGHASKRVFNKIIHHPRGGPLLFAELAADVVGLTLADIIETEGKRIAHEAEQQRKTATRLLSLASRCAGLSSPNRSGGSVPPSVP